MAYVNLPANLQDMFYTLSDRVTKLETGPSGPQDTADAANIAATAASATAVAAQTTATGAQTTANGKNTVYYNTYDPTSQANTAGDLWFTYTTGGIVTAQWTGQGGTSWTQNTLASTVIANLDAGKITTGILDATLVTVTTSPTASNSITFSGANTSIDFKVGGTPRAHIVPLSAYGILMHYGTYADPGGTTYPQMYIGSSNASMGASSSYYFSSVVGQNYAVGSTTVSGQLTVSGNLMVQTMSSLSATGVVWSSSNSRFYLTTSTERHKDNITPIPEADYLSKILSLQPVTFNYKPEFTDNPEQIISGLIAERVAEIPEFSTVINLDKDGLPESIAYDRLLVFIIPALKQINNRLTALEAK